MRRNYSNLNFGAFNPSGRRPLPTGVKYLLIANGVMYIMQMLFGRELTVLLGLTPIRVLQDLSVYQLFTYMFLHSTTSIFHILFNMLMLWMFGTEIEFTWGTRQFLKYYFLTGIAGGIFTIMFLPNSPAVTIGASAAIYGLLVAYAVMFPNRMILVFFLIPMRVKFAVLIFVGIEFLASMGGSSDGVAHLAHLGGAAIGFVYLKLDWRLRNIFRFLSPKRAFDSLRYRSKSRKMNKNRQETEEIMKRVDHILDKINDVGIENISEEERQFLGSASEILSKKGK
ncbi:MAG: rhomboid family intramembrane serine protease [FCB group bacterium]|nr:rhomboid family intramembrane serine protease [FCB group bacterium]